MDTNDTAPDVHIETEEDAISQMTDDPDLQEAMRNASKGIYSHTLLEMWEDQLNNELVGFASQAGIDVYDVFLRNWPWLGYGDVERCRKELLVLTQESLNVFDQVITDLIEKEPRTRQELFASAENDWDENNEYYMEVIARWTALANSWGQKWAVANMRERPILHVCISIATNRVIGPQGLSEQIRNLRNFQFSREQQEALSKRIESLINGDEDE